MKKKQTISLRSYARHRGVNLSAVQRAIKDGRIATEPNGKIDPQVCDLAWDQATDPSKQRKIVKARKVMKHAEKFAIARADTEDYKGKLFRLKFEREAGLLVEAAVVRKRAYENTRVLRESLLNLPNQLAVELAAETDPLKVINMLTLEITNCLEELAGRRVEAARAGIPPLLQDQTQVDSETYEDDDELELDGLPVDPPR